MGTNFLLAVAGMILCWMLTKWLLPPIKHLLKRAGWVRQNYKGDFVPVGFGIVMLFSYLVVGSLIVFAEKFNQTPIERRELFFLSFGMAFLGLLDDALGSRETGGFFGHFKKWVCEKELTTGLMKAVGGGLIAFVAALWSSQVEDYINIRWFLFSLVVDTLVIALMTNWMNLLDVRPGRALKGALLKILVLLLFVPSEMIVPLLLLAGVVLAYLPMDLHGQGMMGDVGSNFIGAIVGYLIVQSFTVESTSIILLCLIGIHGYTEIRSLSQLIQNNKWLSWFDELGR